MMPVPHRLCRPALDENVLRAGPPSPNPLPPIGGRGLRRVGEAEPSLTRSWVRGRLEAVSDGSDPVLPRMERVLPLPETPKGTILTPQRAGIRGMSDDDV